MALIPPAPHLPFHYFSAGKQGRVYRSFLFSALCAALFLFTMPLKAEDLAQFSFQKLHGPQLAASETIRLHSFLGKKTILLFWRSDCGPCLKELTLLPDIVPLYPDMRFVLVALRDETVLYRHIYARLPPEIHMLIARDPAASLLEAAGNQRRIIPFSLALAARGKTCGTHYGILTPATLNQWDTQC